ncbi:hypothetical protein Y032_0090g2390 [Ancylostoma ceylanicum]|uniref:General transcription factor IIH subunit 4 n=1 Tax=Ancylostoma ceylanicum TaxID=53326 RepID=A0A016TN06_9BILA|nr:hypothetical protein Y032_0090g2390 [Ancylostoma ceylanicum]
MEILAIDVSIGAYMSGKKKTQKKKGRAKDVGGDDFDDLVENANDDGCGLSRKYATDIIRLIKCHSKPLNKVAAEFIEIFKERCSLVVGMALLAIYDDLAPTDDIASKIVTVYLIYRVRDIEVALRRRNPGGIEDILGHPFMSFFLNLVESKVVEDICVSYPLPIGIERSIVLRILNGKTSEFANMSAIDLLAGGAMNDSNLGFTEAEQYYSKQTARWPEHLDMVTIPAILPFPDPEDNSLHDLTQDALLMSLMRRISCEPLKQLPFKTTPLMPPLYPIQPIELGCDDIEELRNRVSDSQPAPGTSKEKTPLHTDNPAMNTLVTAVPSQELTEEQMAEFTRRLLDGKSLTQSETKQMLKSLERADANNKFVNQFVQMSDADLSRLIDLNVKIAIEVIDLCVSADRALANRIMRIVQGMDVTVQCMEVVTRLYQYRPELPRDPLNDYVRYCVRYCLDATPSSNLNRVVRLVAITLKNLLKSGSISASELSLELREFGVRFCQHPDTTFLFNTDVRSKRIRTRFLLRTRSSAAFHTWPMAVIGTLSSSGNLFLDYVCTLSAEDRSFLYAQPACALFVFRMLPSVSQQVVIKMIWNSNVSASMSHDTSKIELESSQKLLLKLGLVTSGDRLHPSFRQSYLRAIMLGTQKCSKINPVEVDAKRRQNEKELGKKAGERWECILRYLALPSDKNMNSVSSTTRELFSAAGFTSDNDGSADLEITSAGFQFLLLSPVQQLWTYMIEYLKLETSKGRDIRPIIDLLIRVILCVVIGGDLSNTAFEINSDWTEEQTTLVMHMRELGLIFIRKRKDGVFFLTPLLLNLCTGASDDENAGYIRRMDERRSGNIIVETNFRLYAYTSSSLQLAILSTFTEMTYRFNDMSVGILTRESVRRALQVGITASQIISFLRANAHKQCLATGGPLNCLPVTVADQIRLWEDERKRLTFTEATLYSAFEGEPEFIGVRDFSLREGILLWADSDKKLVIVSDEGHEKVRAWWKANKASM